MKALLQVAIGGAIGACLRFSIGLLLKPVNIDSFPIHTFLVNILGCLAIGICAAFITKGQSNQLLQLFVMTGILGGFTTFSSFSLETFYLFQAQKYSIALLYLFSSIILGIGATCIGFLIPKWVL